MPDNIWHKLSYHCKFETCLKQVSNQKVNENLLLLAKQKPARRKEWVLTEAHQPLEHRFDKLQAIVQASRG